MIPSPVPKELQNLTQFEEMLIATAFPVMHVYTKPRGGQKAYKGHVITLPQGRQRGRVLRASDLKSVGRGFKSRSDH